MSGSTVLVTQCRLENGTVRPVRGHEASLNPDEIAIDGVVLAATRFADVSDGVRIVAIVSVDYEHTTELLTARMRRVFAAP